MPEYNVQTLQDLGLARVAMVTVGGTVVYVHTQYHHRVYSSSKQSTSWYTGSMVRPCFDGTTWTQPVVYRGDTERDVFDQVVNDL